MTDSPTIDRAKRRRSLYIALALGAIALFAYLMGAYKIIQNGGLS